MAGIQETARFAVPLAFQGGGFGDLAWPLVMSQSKEGVGLEPVLSQLALSEVEGKECPQCANGRYLPVLSSLVHRAGRLQHSFSQGFRDYLTAILRYLTLLHRRRSGQA